MVYFYRILIALALFCGLGAQASQIYIEPTTGTGLSSSDLASANDLIRSSVEELGGNTVVEDASKADYTLKSKMIPLGQALILKLSKFQNGEIVFSTQLKAEKRDELDKIALRLTRSVLAGKIARSDGRVGEVTDQESHEGAQRRPVRKALYIGFGGSTFSNLNASKLGYDFSAGYAFDVNRTILKLMAEGAVSGSAFMVNGGLEGNYFFTLEDTAPYLAADFGVGTAKTDAGTVLNGDVVAGFQAGWGGGIQFLRTTSIALDIGLRVNYLFHANAYGLPTVYSLRLGLYF